MQGGYNRLGTESGNQVVVPPARSPSLSREARSQFKFGLQLEIWFCDPQHARNFGFPANPLEGDWTAWRIEPQVLSDFVLN